MAMGDVETQSAFQPGLGRTGPCPTGLSASFSGHHWSQEERCPLVPRA